MSSRLAMPERNSPSFDYVQIYRINYDRPDLREAANVMLYDSVVAGICRQYIVRYNIPDFETLCVMVDLSIAAIQFVNRRSLQRTPISSHHFDWVREGPTVELLLGTGPSRPDGCLCIAPNNGVDDLDIWCIKPELRNLWGDVDWGRLCDELVQQGLARAVGRRACSAV